MPANLGLVAQNVVRNTRRRHEPKSSPLDGLDEVLALTGIADSLANSRNAAGQRRFRNSAPAPNRSEEVVLGHDPIAIFDQINKKIKDLWLGLDEIRATPQLAAADIERTIAEVEPQDHPPRQETGRVLRE